MRCELVGAEVWSLKNADFDHTTALLQFALQGDNVNFVDT
jgi:hypothetical protein